MSNEQERLYSGESSTVQHDQTFQDERYTRYRDTNSEFDDTLDSVVHGGRTSNDQSFSLATEQRGFGTTRRHYSVDAGLDPVSQLPTNPLGVNIQQSTSFGGILQTTLASTSNTTTAPIVTATPRTSTPLTHTAPLNTMDNLVNQMRHFNLADTAIRPPDYLPSNAQVQRIHHMELQEQKSTADTAKQMYNILNALIHNQPEAANLIPLRDTLNQQAQAAAQLANEKLCSLRKAQTVVNYYKSPIQKPLIQRPPDDYRKTFHRTSPKEIMSVTGVYDPKNGNADFQHIWSKLIGYGQANYFNEQEYKDALRYILQGDAYDTFLSFEQTNQTFDYMIEYFGQVYMKKRTRDADRQAVDKFARYKDEPLEACMHRSQVAIDRLRHLHRDVEWPEARKAMRRNILTQVITDETRKYIQMEEDETLETMGYTYDLETLISMASKYEKIHNKAPKKELPTVFQVASGGLVEDPHKLKTELQALKKENFTDKNLLRELVTELIANPAMPRRFSTNDGRESRRTSRDDDRRVQRRDGFNASRKMEVDTDPLLPNTPFAPTGSKAYEKRVEFPPRSPTPHPRQPLQQHQQTPRRESSASAPSSGRSPSPYGQRQPERSDSRPRYDNQGYNRPSQDQNRPPYPPSGPSRPYSRERSYADSNQRRPPSQERNIYSYDRQRSYSNNNRDYSRDRDRPPQQERYDRPRNNYRPRTEYSSERYRENNRDNRSSNYRDYRNYSRDRDREYYRDRPRSISRDRVQNNNKKNLAIEDRSRPRDRSYRGSTNERENEPQSRNRSLTPGSKNVYVTINGVEYKKLPDQEN